MPNVLLFTLAPGRFGSRVSVGTCFDYISNAFAKTATDFFEHGCATAVFDDIVQQRRDGEVFVASGFEYQGRDAQQVGDVRSAGAFADLAGVLAGGEEQGLLETAGEGRGRFSLACHLWFGFQTDIPSRPRLPR